MNSSVKYAQKIINQYGGNGTKATNAKSLNQIGDIAKLVLTKEQYHQWILDEGPKWNDDAPGKDEYYQLLNGKD